jgi:hypothetical protein
MISTEYALLALAAIPVGYVVYNALRVRDGRAVEQAPPEVRRGAWRTCSTEPLAGEELTISIGSLELARTTDAEGHASVDLSKLAALAASDGSPADRRALVHHAGSRDVTVDLGPSACPGVAP